MKYLEIKCRISPLEIGSEILTALLGDIGCDSFMDWEEGLLAYIPADVFSEEKLKQIQLPSESGIQWNYEISQVEDRDWNAVWESNYEPVWIDGQCYIHAPFHPAVEGAAYDILIEPKMSFGTAHHETTAQMLSFLLEEDCKGKSLLDMGSGTGVLAILASKKGAAPVTAIDIDEWAYSNILDNNRLNHTEHIRCLLGDARSIPDETYDIILANINRNILLQDMPVYAKHLKPGGVIFFSGFYEGEDLTYIREKAESLGLTYDIHKTRNRWVAARFVKA